MITADKHYNFSWDDLGDIDLGRPNLGPLTSIISYRSLAYSFRDVISKRVGLEETRIIFREAGHLAGEHFCTNMLDRSLPVAEFLASLEKALITLKMGVLRIEEADFEKQTMTLTISEDLDCSGLPIFGETVCDYDEGFLAGILFAYTGKKFTAEEIACWATGDRTCRFRITPREEL